MTFPVVITARLILNLKASRVSQTTDYHSLQPRAPSSHIYGSDRLPTYLLDQSATLWNFNAVLNVLGVFDMGSTDKLECAGQRPVPHTYHLNVRSID